MEAEASKVDAAMEFAAIEWLGDAFFVLYNRYFHYSTPDITVVT